ncbi:hypothetical protein BCR35DRAFT_18455 [Leucosporidium creatinivorum]|uniref:Mid2 domain-containing protein n=1 Tax=Leucosporidium creatinivorum TaxID=106004 RepID=A0A1Y2D2N2_9BASI|nr:hypothetical protein BCR35DRAFT_18455 [Leucosporidium creatinivorum]
MARWALSLALLATTALAQNSTSRSSSTSVSSSSGTLSTASLITSGTATASKTSTSTPAFPTANSTTTSSSDLYLWVPELVECEEAVLAFRGPPVSKTCGVYVTNTSSFLELLPLDGSFTSLTTATFGWLVDVPAGLTVNVQIFASYNGKTISYTSNPIVVSAGNSTSCLATNEGQNTQSILSYASSIDPSFTYGPSSTASTGSSTPVGPIAGGVIGGVAALTIVAFALFFFKRRLNRERQRQLTAEHLEMASKEVSRPTLGPHSPSYVSAHAPLVHRSSLHYPEPVSHRR